MPPSASWGAVPWTEGTEGEQGFPTGVLSRTPTPTLPAFRAVTGGFPDQPNEEEQKREETWLWPLLVPDKGLHLIQRNRAGWNPHATALMYS